MIFSDLLFYEIHCTQQIICPVHALLSILSLLEIGLWFLFFCLFLGVHESS